MSEKMYFRIKDNCKEVSHRAELNEKKQFMRVEAEELNVHQVVHFDGEVELIYETDLGFSNYKFQTEVSHV